MSGEVPRMQRPKAESIELSDLLEEAKRGKYALPDFQRALAWKEPDRIKLFDSIYRGFPIGGLLFWEPGPTPSGEPAPQVTHQFGPFEPIVHDPSPQLVADGQQRMATLFGCLLGVDPESPMPLSDDMDWGLAFDCDRGTIGRLERPPSPQMLPLPIAMDTSRYLRWARQLPETLRDARTRMGDDFSKALRTYRIPYYVVQTADRKLLQEVFERTNNTGKRLTKTDVFKALFPGQDDLAAIARELGADFGCLDKEWMLQAIKLLVNMDPANDFSAELSRSDRADSEAGHPGETRTMLDEVHPRLRAAGQRAVHAVQHAGIYHVDGMPNAALALAVLIHLFDRFPILRDEDVTRLVWWLAAWGKGVRNRSTYQRAMARLLREAKTSGEAVASLIGYAKADLNEVKRSVMNAKHDWRSAATQVVSLALFSLEPRSLFTEAPIDVWAILPQEGERMFRQIWTRETGPQRATTANRLICAPNDDSPSRILDLASGLMPVNEVVLQSQAITPEAWEALARRDKGEFLKLRHERIGEVVSEFLMRKLT